LRDVTQRPPARARLGHRPALDGLRALAIGLVFLHHTGALLVPSWQNRLFPAGFLGVDVFFVLSGFLITTLLLERRGVEPHPVRTFYARRVLRLFPAVIALVLAVLAYALITDRDVANAARAVAVVGTYTANWAALSGIDYSHYVGHLWSLAIEEQFYLLWPLLLFGAMRLGCSRRQMLWIVLGAAAAAAAWRATLWEPGAWLRIYIRTDAQADSILIGAALALLPAGRLAAAVPERARGPLAWLALAAVVATAETLQPSSAVLYVGGFLVLALVVALLIALVLEPGPGPYGLLTLAPVLVLGRLSYSLYLWHYPIFLVVAERTGGWSGAARVPLAWVLALGAAAASYRFVELPALRRKTRLEPRREAADEPRGEPQVAPAGT
jgi:peptidoglycan/LPS O-acetylase OafA/YrhL